MFILILFSLFFLPSCSQSKSVTLSEREEVTESIQHKRVFLRDVKGVIIAGDGQMPPYYVIEKTKGVQFYRSMRFASLGTRKKFQRQLENLMIGQTLTYENLEEVKAALAEFYQGYGKRGVQVSVVEYEIARGVLVIIVPY